MTRPAVLQTGRLPPSLEQALAADYDVTLLPAAAQIPAFLAAQGSRFEAAVTSSKVGADAALIAGLPNLKAITHLGVGYDSVDVGAAAQRGIPVSNTPDVLNDCVADIAIGLLIDAARGMSASERFVRRGDWLKGQFPLTTRVSGKKPGIVGLGRIGQTIAKRATGLDMDIRYHSRKPVQGVAWTGSMTSPVCPKRCSSWTTWRFCRTWPAARMRRARPWPTWCWTTCGPGSGRAGW